MCVRGGGVCGLGRAGRGERGCSMNYIVLSIIPADTLTLRKPQGMLAPQVVCVCVCVRKREKGGGGG